MSANANHMIKNEEEKQIKIEMPQNLLTGEFEDLELLIGGEKMDYVTEKELLQNLVKDYKQGEVNLERKFLELKGLKERKSAIAQMQRQLEKKTAKLDSLKTIIASLQSERKIIQEKIREDVLSKKQLDIAKKMISEMQWKKEVNGSPVKEQILMLQQQVTELQKYNGSGRNATVNKKLNDVQDIELEVLELKRRNKELELEKREIGIELATVQARIRTEEETVSQIKEEISGLRHVQEELSEQVEILQRNRFDMVQELVYQRWLYTCLRFEVHDHKKQSRKASRLDCSQDSSKELYGKTHALTFDPELESNSSNATFEESDEIETTTLESPSSSQSSSSNNSSFLGKIKRWKKTKDYSNNISSKGRNYRSNPGLVRRFSMSMVASELSKPRNSDDSSVTNLSQKFKMQSCSKSIEKPIIRRMKRVSFSDSVKLSTYEDMPEAVEDVIDDKETRSGKIMGLTSSTMRVDKHKAEQSDKTSNSNEYVVGNPINNDSVAENEGTENKIGHSDKRNSRNVLVCRKEDKIKTQLVQLVAFFFFLLILLAYLMIK
ncbi:protein CHUP1, chloroplastic-like isoform X2 [Gastrolobium bilobum]|uniref:protein CHUP1, chloroplastic-like isoform X2 n=1 Tax=Gastrolobium bilobum TaxID=150636 RepID=UPI002AB1A238|nr:protein CHUP1, chloroplastic-like isoform X2 [Gastrolobium bilobum]